MQFINAIKRVMQYNDIGKKLTRKLSNELIYRFYFDVITQNMLLINRGRTYHAIQ